MTKSTTTIRVDIDGADVAEAGAGAGAAPEMVEANHNRKQEAEQQQLSSPVLSAFKKRKQPPPTIITNRNPDNTDGGDGENAGSDGDVIKQKIEDERLKSIGKKTRQCLREELSKRKEIVRLEGDDDDFILLQQQRHSSYAKKMKKYPSSNFAKATATAASLSTTLNRKRKSTLWSKSRKHDEDKNEHRKQTDTWCPSTKHLHSNDDISKGERSNIVQLHGLPIGTKMEHIRKFFTGLSPQRIFMLPSLKKKKNNSDDDNTATTTCTKVDEFDADCHEEEHKRNDFYVERYHPTNLRIFVKFQSYLIANIAISRSGEVLRIHDDDGNNTTTTAAAAIAITPISKRFASYLQRKMSIDAIKGEGLYDTMQDVERNVPQVINEILWVMTKKELKLQFHMTSIGGGAVSTKYFGIDHDYDDTCPTSTYPSIDVNDLLHIRPATTKRRQHQLITLYNHLLDIHELIEKECSVWMMQDYHPLLSSTLPTHRLICTASTWILDQLDVIKKCIDATQLHIMLSS